MTRAATTFEYPERKRFSSYLASRLYFADDYPSQRHELYLPDTDTSPDPRGLLVHRAILDKNGRVSYTPSWQDSHYGYVASSLARMHTAGFAPVLDGIGLSVTYGKEQARGQTERRIGVHFPPTETFVSLGNAMLSKCGAELRLAAMPPGQYSAEDFVAMFSEHIYPISTCGPTPDQEQNDDEYGVHDMLLHGAAVMALATTEAYPLVHNRALAVRRQFGDHNISYGEAVLHRETFMQEIDGGLHVMNFADLLYEDSHRDVYFDRAIGEGWGSAKVVRYQQAVADNIREPLAHGYAALAEVAA